MGATKQLKSDRLPLYPYLSYLSPAPALTGRVFLLIPFDLPAAY
ncbi:MAG: hypothetical protein AB1589_34080 [Cyanobacteriota bacterium]